MFSRMPKRKWFAFTLIVALLLLALWSLSFRRAPVRVTFQHTTNDPANGRIGVIEVVNNLNETVVINGGWYVPAKRKDLSQGHDTPSASLSQWNFTARSTNIAQVAIPTNGGSYRLVLWTIPESRSPWRKPAPLPVRIYFFLYPHCPFWLTRWLINGSTVASQTIDFTQ